MTDLAVTLTREVTPQDMLWIRRLLPYLNPRPMACLNPVDHTARIPKEEA